MTRRSLVQEAHAIIKQHLKPGALAVDATTGNGHDTLFLAKCVGPNGHVYGFDIQAQALTSTHSKLQQHGLRQQVTLIHASHAIMADKIPAAQHGLINAIMFNLGYLPGSDKIIMTQTESTLTALTTALELLIPTGVISILAYPGHAGGDSETDNVQYWCAAIANAHIKVRILLSAEHKNTAPRLFVIEKL